MVMKPETVIAQRTRKIESEAAFISVCSEKTFPWDAGSQGDQEPKDLADIA